MAQKRSQPTLHTMEGSQSNYSRKTSILRDQQTLGPTRGPEDPSPRVWTQDSPRTVSQTKPRFASNTFGTSQDTGFFDCPGLRGSKHFLRIRKPVLHFAGGSMSCGVPWNTKTLRILKFMDSHHLVVRLVVVVYICAIYLLTLAAYGTDIAIGTFNKPV